MIIIDMDMPDDCFKCQINRVCSHRWFLNPYEGRPDDCPIKAELTAKHGRLIDADEITAFLQLERNGENVESLDEFPTVIEAEGEA